MMARGAGDDDTYDDNLVYDGDDHVHEYMIITMGIVIM